jgi:hypothetical protein
MLQGGSYIVRIAPPFCSRQDTWDGVGVSISASSVREKVSSAWMSLLQVHQDDAGLACSTGSPRSTCFSMHVVKGIWFCLWCLGGKEKWSKLGMAMFASYCSYDLKNSQPYLINQIVWAPGLRKNSSQSSTVLRQGNRRPAATMTAHH